MKSLEKIYHQYNELLGNAINLKKFNQYAVVHHSNFIEGSTLTLDETILLLDENLTPKNKPLEHSQMAIDHFKALQYVIALAKEKQTLSNQIIKNIGALVKKNTGSIHRTIAGDIDESKGDWRTVPAKAGVSTFKATQIPERVQTLINEVNQVITSKTSFISINRLAFDAHFQLVSIHPFSDGNGRSSRLLMNYVQQYHNFPLSFIHSEDKSDYYTALVESKKQENIELFENFMFTQLEKMMEQEITKFKKVQNSKKDNSRGLSFIF